MYKNKKLLQSIYLLAPPFVKNGLATIYSIIVSQKKYGSNFKKWSALLKKSQYYSPTELEKLQVELLKDFLASAISNSKFYKKVAEENGIDPNQINDLSIIRKFPVINKPIVRLNYQDIVNEKRKKYKFSSSGTTGTSLHIYLDDEAYQREYAFRWHYLNGGGATRKDRFAFFLGNNLYPVEQQKPPFHLIDYYEHSLFFSLFHMSDANLKHYIKEFNKFKPSFVKGYPSGLYVFASYAKANNLKVYQPKAIYSASETLHDYQKSLLEEVFQCPVFQWYGQVETTVNIHECEHHRMHIKEEYGLLELLNEKGEDAKPGEVASVIGTGWGNKAFPLIRYDTGDNMILAHDQQCPCGRNGRIIERIMGRDEDFIVTPDGRKIGRLDFIFKPVNTVAESQIIQETIDLLKVKLVALEGYSKADEAIIRGMISKYIGNSMTVEFELVDKIERTANGKIRYVISKVR